MVLASANPCDPEPNKSAWLSLMEQLSSEEELQRHEKRLVDVLRQMFEASGNDETRARTAARHITSIFHDSMSGNMPKFDQESLVLFYIDTFETIVLELAKAVQFPSTEHRRLVSFILQLRDMTNELLEAPDGTSCLEALQHGLDEGSKGVWSKSDIARKGSSWIESEPTLYSQECMGHLSLGALFAQLYQAGLLNYYGALFISSEMRHIFGLEGEKPLTDVYDLKAVAYWRELACQDIILAGERLSKEIKTAGEIHKVTKEQWRTWAVEFEKLAASTDEDPWVTRSMRATHTPKWSSCLNYSTKSDDMHYT